MPGAGLLFANIGRMERIRPALNFILSVRRDIDCQYVRDVCDVEKLLSRSEHLDDSSMTRGSYTPEMTGGLLAQRTQPSHNPQFEETLN